MSLVQTSFSSMLVESSGNLIVAKMFLGYTIITEKSLWRLMFQSVVLHVYFYFLLSFFDLRRQNTFSLVLRSKSMFSKH